MKRFCLPDGDDLIFVSYSHGIKTYKKGSGKGKVGQRHKHKAQG